MFIKTKHQFGPGPKKLSTKQLKEIMIIKWLIMDIKIRITQINILEDITKIILQEYKWVDKRIA